MSVQHPLCGLSVGIARDLYQSHDGGQTWSRDDRVIPPLNVPLCYPDKPLPAAPALADDRLDMIHFIGANGVVIGHRDGQRRTAFVHTTSDSGNSWTRIPLDRLQDWGTVEPRPDWPPEKFDSVLLSRESIVLAWSDPRLFDLSQSYLLTIGRNLRVLSFRVVDDMCLRLAVNRGGVVRAFSSGKYLESADSGNRWAVHPFRIEWSPNHDGYQSIVPLLRWPQFLNDHLGFALVMTPHAKASAPPLTCLARTVDGGRTWRVIQEWIGPKSGDRNERHVTDLRIFEIETDS